MGNNSEELQTEAERIIEERRKMQEERRDQGGKLSGDNQQQTVQKFYTII